MTNYSSGDIARMIELSPSTVRNWGNRYAIYLSPDAEEGGERVYTVDDAAIFQKVAELRNEGFSHGEIDQQLQAGIIDKIAGKPTEEQDPSVELLASPDPVADTFTPSSTQEITNCHIHTFTAAHVPDDFLPFGLTRLLRQPYFRNQLAFLAKLISPFFPEGKVRRYLQFMEVSNLRSQKEILEHIQGFYPPSTRFIVLAMDMEFMDAGTPPSTLEQQHKELLALAKPASGVIPFCAVDPRRPRIVELTKQWIADGFRGIKLYPNLGYSPRHPALLQIYEFAEQQGVPIIVHCSPGGIKSNTISPEDAAQFSHPRHYDEIAQTFPQLRICLAHFGGHSEWEKYRKKEWYPGDEKSWISIIADLIRIHENVFTDISYTMFHFQENIPILKIFLTDPSIRNSVLFGSDYYMVELEQLSEREVSIQIRAALGEELFNQIAHMNPQRFLGEDN